MNFQSLLLKIVIMLILIGVVVSTAMLIILLCYTHSTVTKDEKNHLLRSAISIQVNTIVNNRLSVGPSGV